MKTRIDDQFQKEAVKFKLRFSCEHCAHFDPVGDRCAEGYPTFEHRSSSLQRRELLFCKLFEGG